MRTDRIRLSDKTASLRPRRAATKLGQAYEPEVLVKVREWIGPALASPDFVLKPQPPAQPHSCVVVADQTTEIYKKATSTITIVAYMGLPVEYGLVASLARPAGNITVSTG